MSVLSEQLVKEFAKATRDTTPKKTESFVYGEAVVTNGEVSGVKFDGSDIVTPCTSTVSVSDGDRVLVLIKNRQAVITSNITSPTVSNSDTYNWSNSNSVTRDLQTVLLGASEDAPLSVQSDDDYDGSSANVRSDSILIENGNGSWVRSDPDNGIQLASDSMLKTDVRPIDPELALRLRPVSYKLMYGGEDRTHYGFLAQDVETVAPDLIAENLNSNYLGLNYLGFIAPILATVQDLERRIQELESERN